MGRLADLSRRTSNVLTLKRVSIVSVVLNISSIILGLFYIIIPIYTALWDVFGVILIAAFFNNLLLACLSGNKLNKSDKLGKKLNLLLYIYLAYTIMAMLGILAGNFIISMVYTNDIIIFTGIIYFWYFSFLGIGLLLGFFILTTKDRVNLWNGSPAGQYKDFLLKKLLRIGTFLIFLGSLYMSIAVIVGPYFDITVVPVIIGGMLGAFLSFIFLAITIIHLKLRDKQKNPKMYLRIGFLGIIISAFLLMPLIFTPYAYYSADVNISSAFGDDWRSNIDTNIEQQYFLQTPFSTPQYYLGMAPKECLIMEDQKFYDDGTYQLYFDAYLPDGDPKTMPGKGSTLIRIHGGGWVIGDKGKANMLQMNKYFAAQGYIVYDIQYFIYDMPLLGLDPVTPKYRKGNFSMYEIVESLGFFTQFIAANKETYGNPNLDSVFVSGGSAGGHLTCALALGISSGKYVDILGNDLTIKGIIPYYPANGQAKWFGLSGDEEIFNPEILVDSNSPPCLIYQGSHDILNWFSVAQGIKDRYDTQGTGNCAILWFPMGGHASDYYYNGYYNQCFLYYLERFMYLCVNDLI